jgi:hypothetical protein
MSGLTWREELGIEKVTGERKPKEKPECGAWVELPSEQPKEGPPVKGHVVKCDRGRHRGKQHSHSFEFFMEEGTGENNFRNAVIMWRT